MMVKLGNENICNPAPIWAHHYIKMDVFKVRMSYRNTANKLFTVSIGTEQSNLRRLSFRALYCDVLQKCSDVSDDNTQFSVPLKSVLIFSEASVHCTRRHGVTPIGHNTSNNRCSILKCPIHTVLQAPSPQHMPTHYFSTCNAVLMLPCCRCSTIKMYKYATGTAGGPIDGIITNICFFM